MNSTDGQIITWLASSLFWTGVMLVPLGLMLLLVPAKAMKLADYLNRWVSTQAFFDSVNQPRYQEKFFYRYHHYFGAVIVFLALFSIYMLVFYAGMQTTAGYFLKLAESEFEQWLFVNLYYLLILMLLLALLVGLAIYFRPSALKKLEVWSNRWVKTEEKLSSLDKVHDIPGNILAEKPRLFGLFVLLGSAYIIYMTADRVFS